MGRPKKDTSTDAASNQGERNLLTGNASDIVSGETVSLAEAMTKKPSFIRFRVWLVGDTPLITHAWSHKARLEMLQKQIGAPKAGKENRKPEEDFQSSLYRIGSGDTEAYGFPVTGIKNCVLSSAHKDKGISKTNVQAALWLDAEMVRVGPALAGAICDMPLVRVYGSKPECREDMVKIGSGLNKVASLAYRAQFTRWAIRVSGRFNSSSLNSAQVAFLFSEAGTSYGLGEWRNERKGMFGAFHLARAAEEKLWDAYAAGEGPLPPALEDETLSLVAAE